MGRRIEFVALIDSQGRTAVLDEKGMAPLAGCYSHELRNILQLILGTGNFDSVYYLLEGWIQNQLNKRSSCKGGRRLLAVYRAKARFLQKLLDLDFSAAELRSRGMSFRFHLGKKEMLWFLLDLFEEIVEMNAYNVLPENVNGNVVMDIGAHLGVFSLFAAKMGAKKVYAFEPVESTYEMLGRNVEINDLDDTISPVNKALGDKIETGCVSYLFEGDWGASLELDMGTSAAQQECEVTTVDEFVRIQGTSPHFIKIDAEGYEKKIILGAENTIRTSKPFLSICAYHKKGDVEELAKTVLSVRKDYKYQLLETPSLVLYFC